MYQLDLTKFAQYSEKIPSSFLMPYKRKENISLFKIFSSHLIDYFMCVFGAYFLDFILVKSIEMFITPNFIVNQPNFFTQLIFPLFVFSYFFFSYFFNNGQTWGMSALKTRFELKSQNFIQTLKFAAHSTIFCLTYGLYLLFSRRSWESIRIQDHLYSAMMEHKDIQQIDLLSRLNSTSTTNQEEEIYDQVA